MDALILVGGKGTRLQPVVKNIPKPMAIVAGRPFLEWLILALRKQGISRVILCTGYKSAIIEEYFRNEKKWNMEIVFSHEPFSLGTAGAIRLASQQIKTDPFLVLNGDSFTPFLIKRIERFHLEKKARVSLYLVFMDDSSRYGSIIISEQEEIQSFEEKSPYPRPGWINEGIYLMNREILNLIPENKNVSLENDIFPVLTGNGLYGLRSEAVFIDIGVPETYKKSSVFYPWDTLI